MTQAQAGRFGRYELVSRLGRGGMAETWRARLVGAAGITKPVLIKKVLPQNAQDEAFIRMFISEARISATLSHGNIAQVHDFGQADGEYFLAMEFVDGQPLHHVIQRALKSGLRCVPLHLATFIALEMCRGLHYAHTRSDDRGAPLGIVHRDISPDNVLISYEGQVKIVDFGIAKARLQRGFSTEPGVVKGKYLFFSPEQARGEEVDVRTDVWATGVVLYEMVCGKLPLEGTEYVVMTRLQQGQFPRPRELNPDLPPALDDIIMKALAVEKEERFESAHAFGDALAGFLYSTTPRFSALSVAYLLRELFRNTLEQEGRDAKVPASFREELSVWRAEPKPRAPVEAPPPLSAPALETASTTREVASEPPRPRGMRVLPRAQRTPWRVGVGAGVLVCMMGAAALLWGTSAPLPLPGGPPPPGPIARAPENPGPPPPQPLTPVPVPQPPPQAAAPAQAAAAEKLQEGTATWPVDTIRLDARRDLLRVNITVVATTDLKPERTYTLKEIPFFRNLLMSGPDPKSKYKSKKWEREWRLPLPLFFLVQGRAVSAKEALGVVQRAPVRIKGGSNLLLFSVGPRVDGANIVPRMVEVADEESRQRRKVIIHPEWMTASADKAFFLKGLDPSAQYRLTLTPVGEGAFTRGPENGPVRTVACVQDTSQDVGPPGQEALSPAKVQRFLLQEDQGYRIGRVSGLRCGFVDEDPSDNQGEVEISVEQLGDKGR